MSKTISSLLASGLCCISLMACQNNYEIPSFNCQSVTTNIIINEKNVPLQLVNSNLFRLETDTGYSKHLSMESISDSLKIVLNIHHGPYTPATIVNDSLPLDTYTYIANRLSNNGSIAVGIKTNSGFKFLTIDSASITLSKLNIKRQIVSGTYYFESGKDATKGTGTFNDACFISMQ
jgi:hypothetical protein